MGIFPQMILLLYLKKDILAIILSQKCRSNTGLNLFDESILASDGENQPNFAFSLLIW